VGAGQCCAQYMYTGDVHCCGSVLEHACGTTSMAHVQFIAHVRACAMCSVHIPVLDVCYTTYMA
jgi:hypothetical protein